MDSPQRWVGKGSKGDKGGMGDKGGKGYQSSKGYKSGKGKKGDKGQRRDPEDKGFLRPELEKTSRRLAMLLRHDGLRQLQYGSFNQGDGWCRVDFLLKHPELEAEGINFNDIQEIVRESFSKNTPRFELGYAYGGSAQHLDVVFIRATHKHSVQTWSKEPEEEQSPLKSQERAGRKQPRDLGTLPPLPGCDMGECMPTTAEEGATGDPLFDVGDPWGGMSSHGTASSTGIPGRKNHETAHFDISSPRGGLINWHGYVTEDGLEWYWNSSTEEAFFAHNPGEWTLYEEPNTQRKYWYKDEANCFFVDSCTRDTPGSNNDEPRDEL